MLAWLLGDAVGPAAVALPVNWAADALAGLAQRWFQRIRRNDDLSRLVKAATGTSADLTHDEFDAVRRLLEDPHTWSMLGRRPVAVLATWIADCLPRQGGRTTEDSQKVALTIARGLLEFAVADLDPKVFQQVLLTRLDRMETDQASALDEALLYLHADLAAHFISVMDQLKRVLDRLPPGPAQRPEIAVYLRTLIDWLSIDPWPQDRRFGGHNLAPATIERRLRLTDTDTGREAGVGVYADDLAERCRRLVILGGPGSGKTWLARRTARRCAERALQVLATGGAVDETELPLFTTCSRLFTADGDIRQAVVSSALDQLGDLGGSRLSAALRVFFAERNAPTLLVIDSLDEAHGSQDRLRQADTLPWRIVLTSRPSSWKHQLAIVEESDSHRVGELQSLLYPDDVDSFIARWFDRRPAWGYELGAQIAGRRGLQEAATVPLILTLYCIIGGGGKALPDFRHDLYSRALNRILTGRWRDNGDPDPDLEPCLEALRAWAWVGASSNRDTGIGTWSDDILTGRSRLGRPNEDALDHVATRLEPPDVDTGETLRRFIHRSIHEHLVAEHVARLPLNEAVETLLPHLWYDPDWEYTAPAALAMHPQNDQLLREIICRAAGSNRLPTDLSVIDAGGEFRKLLARVASESSEIDWSPEVVRMISQALAELSQTYLRYELGGARSWGTSDRLPTSGELLRQLASATSGWDAGHTSSTEVGRWVDGVVQLASTAEDKRRARDALLGLLASHSDGWFTDGLVDGIVQLASTAEDKRCARDALLGLLASRSYGWYADGLVDGVVQLAPAAEDKRLACNALLKLMPGKTDGLLVAHLVGGVIQLDPTVEDTRRASDALLRLLAAPPRSHGTEQLVGRVIQLAPAAEDRRHARSALLGLLASHTDGRLVADLAGGVIQLDPTVEDEGQARVALLELLASETKTDVAMKLLGRVVQLNPTAEDLRKSRDVLLRLLAREAGSALTETMMIFDARLVNWVVQLAPAAEDRWQARNALLGLLARETKPDVAIELVAGVVQLDPTAEDLRRACDVLLGLLSGIDNLLAEKLVSWIVHVTLAGEDQSETRDALLVLLADMTNPRAANHLVSGVIQLAPAAEDKRQARDALHRLLSSETKSYMANELVGGLLQLAPAAEDKYQARKALLGLLVSQTDAGSATELVDRLVELDPAPRDLRQARDVLLRLLADGTNSYEANRLVSGVIQLAPAAEDKRQARDALLRLLPGETDGFLVADLVGGIVQLDPATQDLSKARDALLRLLAAPASRYRAPLVRGLVQLDPTAQDKRQARDALLGMLLGETDPDVAMALIDGVVQLDPTAQDKRQARDALLGLLARETNRDVAKKLMATIVPLAPSVRDLIAWRSWAAPPNAKLLAAVRRNSTPGIWLEVLPLLAPLSALGLPRFDEQS